MRPVSRTVRTIGGPLLRSRRHRLFHVDILESSAGVGCDHGVIVIPGGNNYRIDIFAIEETPIVGVQFDVLIWSLGVARVKLGHERKLRLGTLWASRDWGFAGDYVRAMQLMLAAGEPHHYGNGTGVPHNVEGLD